MASVAGRLEGLVRGGKLLNAFPSSTLAPAVWPCGVRASSIFCEISQFKNVEKNFKMLKHYMSHYCIVQMQQNNGPPMFRLRCNTVDPQLVFPLF